MSLNIHSGSDTHVTTRALQERSKAALNGFLEALLSNEVAQIEAVLAPSVTATTDGGGRYHAAMQTLHGPTRVAKFMLGVNAKRGAPTDFELRYLNGFPALVARYDDATHPKLAPLVIIRLDVEASGKISAVHSVLAPDKLREFPRRAAQPRSQRSSTAPRRGQRSTWS